MKTPVLITVVILLYFLIIFLAFVFKVVEMEQTYPVVGFIILTTTFILPFFHSYWSIFKRLLVAIILPVIGIFFGIAGFAMADYRIINRLF